MRIGKCAEIAKIEAGARGKNQLDSDGPAPSAL
jgi:hypothetical protein